VFALPTKPIRATNTEPTTPIKAAIMRGRVAGSSPGAKVATLTYGFARIGAALKMRVEDLQSKGSGWLIRLHRQAAHDAVPSRAC
jgi:hypothetical protein